MKKLLLFILLCVPVHAQTAPGTIQPPVTTTALNAVTTNTSSSALSVKLYGAIAVDVTITGGTVNLNIQGQIDSAATFRNLTGVSNADGSTVTTITSSGSYVFPTAGMENVKAVTTSISGATVTVKWRPVPSVGRAIPPYTGNSPPVSLTDNGTSIATNAALGKAFRVTALTANVTLSNPTNATDGQTITWEIIQNASAAKTLSFDTKFSFGAEITGCTISTTTSSHDFITVVYNSTTDRFMVRGCLTGF